MKPLPKRTLPIERQARDLRETSAALLEEIDAAIARCDKSIERLAENRVEREESRYQ